MIYNFKDITGKKFGRLTVIEFSHRRKDKIHYKCICDCGTEVKTRGASLKDGSTQSCGCLNKERTKKENTTHGLSGTTEYCIYQGAIQRCYNKNNPQYIDYGGRGITVCDEWLHSFETFLKDMGNRPSKKHSIDRINNEGNYELGNCRWATSTEQAKNRRSNIMITYKGETLCMMDWSEKLDIKYITLHQRFKNGWSTEKAFTQKVRTRRKR